MRSVLLLAFATSSALAQLGPGGATASFKGSLPPKPTADLSAEQQYVIEKELAAVTESFQAVRKHARAADADIFIKAVRYALEFHEWYDKKPDDGVKKAAALLNEARKRIESLKKNETPWMNGSGQKVLGFYSKIDDSPQPYGVEIPEEYERRDELVPMWIWLHGRGDTATDLHFVYSRLMAKKPGQFQPKGTIVIHPFGRYCNGWKSAGETDVFEARDDAKARFNVDSNRIALAGFSMGGAGAWHLGAHFADQWACVHTGAGFVDVKRYQKLTPDKMPPWYEQKLWGVYDVPDYARNFFNVPLISYSGEFDAQRDSAEYMMEVLGKEGLKPPHLIGPGMGHKYHPETIKEVQRLIEEAVEKGRNAKPRLKLSWQGKTLSYPRMDWVEVLGLQEHWTDSRVDVECSKDGVVRVATKNIAMIRLGSPFEGRPAGSGSNPLTRIVIDDDELPLKNRAMSDPCGWFQRVGDHWQRRGLPKGVEIVKEPGSTGPIDAAFKSSFLVVLPDNPGESKVDQWITAESEHFVKRWRGLMRGDLRVRKASEVTENEIEQSSGLHLILWGTPESNPLIKRSLPELPVTWTAEKLVVGKTSADPATNVPVMVYPSPLSGFSNTYIVLNSGLTFREAHDKTNSLQNPKLPDWAILDITQPPNAESAGKVVAADFFDERWQVIPRVKSPEDRE